MPFAYCQFLKLRNASAAAALLFVVMLVAFLPFNSSSADTTTELVESAESFEWGCIEVFNGSGIPSEQCGLGYWRTLCGWHAGVEVCQTFFELIDEGEPAGTTISNVLFLPGIKGSRLYRADPDCEGAPDACTNKLWEPYGNTAAQQLYLNEDGRAQYADIYARAGDILSAALGQRFYASFVTDLNDLMVSGSFGTGWRWEAGAYDWRLSLADIVTRGKREDDRIYFGQLSETPYLETQLRALARNSPTGKVTVIAHSNGGLVAKALIERLGDEASLLIDTVIFVGVPHLGAPQALGALLFGHGEALPFDGCASARFIQNLCSLLMDRPTARIFAEHAPMAYHLLPSQVYFERARARDPEGMLPLVRFSGTANHETEQAAYGGIVDSEAELHAFAAAAEGGRFKPSPSDTTKPNVLSAALLSYAQEVHTSLDEWRAPPGIAVYHLIGWGAETISGIEFYEEPSVLGLLGTPIPRYRPLFQFDGDGVVPSVSAAGGEIDTSIENLVGTPILASTRSTSLRPNDEKRYWINLQSLNDGSVGSGYGHGTLFESDSVRQLLAGILGAARGTAVPLPAHVTLAEPPALGERSWLRIFLHSPLTLELYAGDKRLGFSDDGAFENQIPGASYDEFGDVKYIRAPGGEPYTLVLRAYDTGIFSLDIQEVAGAHETTTTIAQVPVTTETIAHVALAAQEPSNTAIDLDHDGDGTIDETISLTPGAITVYPHEPANTPSRPVAPKRHTTKRDYMDEEFSPGAEPHIAPSLLPPSQAVPFATTIVGSSLPPAETNEQKLQEHVPEASLETKRRALLESPKLSTSSAPTKDSFPYAPVILLVLIAGLLVVLLHYPPTKKR